MHVMMVSSWQEKCGVAEYTRSLKKPLDKLVTARMIPIPRMTSRTSLRSVAEQINEGDVAHIQYHPDYCGYWRYPWKIHKFHSFLKYIRIPLVITVHDLTLRLPFWKFHRMNFKGVFYNALAVPIINWTPYGKFLLGKFLNAADHLIVHTDVTKRFLVSLNVQAEKISVLYPGIPDIAPLKNSALRDEFGWKNRRLITVFGFIGPEKGYETVLKAMKYLPDDIVLVIAGGSRFDCYDPYLEHLEVLISSLGLQDRVVITGHLDDDRVGAVLTAADIILLPYKLTMWTGTSYALSYALAAKRAVITSDTPFFLEVEQKYAAIRTFKDGDDQTLADAVIEVLNRSGQEEIGAREYRETWSWKNVAERTYQIYCGVLERRCACPSASVEFAGPRLTTGRLNNYENRDSKTDLQS